MTLLSHCCHIVKAIPLLALLGAECAYADIYAYVDTEGKLLVSEKKEDDRFVRFDPKRPISSRISRKVTAGTTSWITFAPRLTPSQQNTIGIHKKAVQYTPLINDIAQETGVNANLLHAIIQVESAYNPAATSSKGAQGLMQLIPTTAQRFGVLQSYDPESNVRGGARYIKNLLTLFDNNLQLALAAYNAGEGAVQKYNNTIPPYPETQAYVSRVLSLFTQREE